VLRRQTREPPRRLRACARRTGRCSPPQGNLAIVAFPTAHPPVQVDFGSTVQPLPTENRRRERKRLRAPCCRPCGRGRGGLVIAQTAKGRYAAGQGRRVRRGRFRTVASADQAGAMPRRAPRSRDRLEHRKLGIAPSARRHAAEPSGRCSRVREARNDSTATCTGRTASALLRLGVDLRHSARKDSRSWISLSRQTGSRSRRRGTSWRPTMVLRACECSRDAPRRHIQR